MKRTSVEWRRFLEEIYKKIKELKKNAEYEKCADCECYFGLLFYLNKELTIIDDSYFNKMFKKHLAEWEKSQEARMHACQGCDSCPPAEWTAEVIKNLES